MTMPKTTVHKNDFLQLPEYKIWSPREIGAMQSVTIAKTEHAAPHDKLD